VGAERVSKERAKRKKARHDVKRAQIFAVAKKVFLREGLDGASLRAIARECEYAPGALYAYYESKEEIYADILRDSLERLRQAAVKGAGAHEPVRALRGAIRGFYRFYRKNPHDFDLSLNLYSGRLGLGGLPSDLEKDLYMRLGMALEIVNQTLMKLRPGMSKKTCQMHRQALASGMMGVLLLDRTGMLGKMGGNPDKLLERHIDLTLKALAE
jgi:AcrR family transcriptional regulator